MTNVGFRVTPTFERPDAALIDRFRGLATSVIGDAMHRTAALSHRLVPFNSSPLVGPAYTVRVPEGDNLMFYYAIDNAQPGDVIVVAGQGNRERALCGEIMACHAKSRGIAGFVIDGAIRDVAEIGAMDFPVYAVASTPNGPFKNGPGTVNEPIAIGDRVIAPGDLIIGDATGVVCVPSSDLDDVSVAAEATVEREAEILERIARGDGMDLAWLYTHLERARIITKEA